MSLENVEILLGIENDERIENLYDRYKGLLLSRLQKSVSDIDVIPLELEYIVEELTIARFNRIGSEGMKSESMDGHSASYAEKSLAEYENDILQYLMLDRNHGKVRFL